MPSVTQENFEMWNLSNVPTNECTCEKCVECCERRPCWGTPGDIELLIEKGFSHQLMLDYWVRTESEGGDIYILCPAIVDYEGRGAPFTPIGRCTFLVNKRCLIHKYKPIEGKYVCECDEHDNHLLYRHLRNLIVNEWDTRKGKEIIEKWKDIMGMSKGMW